MPAREKVSFGLDVEIGDLKRELASIPGITKKEANKMARELQTQFNKAERAAKKAAKATKTSWSSVGTGAAQVGAAITGAAVAVVAFGQHMADLNNQLTDTATVSTLAVDQIAGIKLAAEGSGVAFAKVEKGLRALPKAMNDAAKGTGTAADAFEKLGIDVTDATTGGLRSAEELLPEIFAGLNALPDAASKSAAAMDIFGTKAGGALVQSGAIENLDAFVGLANEFGISTGPKATKAAADFQRQMATLKLVTEGTLAKVLDQFGGAGGLNDALGLAQDSVIILGSIFTEVFNELKQTIQGLVGPALEVVIELLEGDFAGAMRAAERNAAEFAKTGLKLAAGGAPIMLLTSGYRGLTKGIEEARKAEELRQATEGTGTGGGDSKDDEDGGGKGGGGGRQAAIDADIAARQKAADIVAGLSEARISDLERINNAEIAAMESLFDLGVATEEQAWAVTQEFAQRRSDLRAKERDEIMDDAKKAADEALRVQNAHAAAQAAIAGAASSAFATTANQMADSNKKGARAMFAVSKGAALLQVAIDTALAVSRVNAMFPLAGFALSAAPIAVGVASAVAIGAQQPSFHSGGPVNVGPDEMTATLRDREFVSNPTGRQMLGDQTLERANAGMSPRGGEVVAVSVYKHTRQVDRWKRDGLSAGDPISRAITAGRLVGHRSNR